ncbi:hypothetical protein FGK63_03060 [Ruegeria sediminis]|uniref:Uncharacterized protein n=1 Tax=Ruegeria sediminis TaxID=2583820 RepID=A0ABY2X3T7_9RHOB|nr:hypothetical protein [Ruegeria sediminis]TMV10055.1 hypothetical protein FGK63_03060 [Ruegeria sediminis]
MIKTKEEGRALPGKLASFPGRGSNPIAERTSAGTGLHGEQFEKVVEPVGSNLLIILVKRSLVTENSVPMKKRSCAWHSTKVRLVQACFTANLRNCREARNAGRNADALRLRREKSI